MAGRLTPEQEARQIELACELMARVREIDPERNRTWLLSLTDTERFWLLFTLAAMVDPDAPLSMTLGWTWKLVPVDEA